MPPTLMQSANEDSPTRIGISISLIQAAFRHLMPRIAKNLDILVVVHPPAIQCSYLQFLQELEQLLADLEVLNGD